MPFHLCLTCLQEVQWTHSQHRCRKCGSQGCRCRFLKYRGAVKIAFESDGVIQFLIQSSLRKREPATRAVAELLQGWELIRHIKTFYPFTEKDALLAEQLNAKGNSAAYLSATVVHVLSRKEEFKIPFLSKTSLLIALIDARGGVSYA